MQRNILIIDDHDDLASALEEVLVHQGHNVTVLPSRAKALAAGNIEGYDVVITDLDVEGSDIQTPSTDTDPVCLPKVAPAVSQTERVKAFKLCAANFRCDEFDERELTELFATILDYKIRYVDTSEMVSNMREHIEFELPSAIALMHIVLEYLTKRVEKLGVVKTEQSNLFVALDEAFVNAIKHGNKFDLKKLVRLTAEISPQEARFTIEDEGEGFDLNSIPDPLDPENLFKPSGRGVLFIYNIMDEVMYNDRGNRLTMIKKASSEKERPA
jgi:serine/threonine-protein kinase RsbW